MLGLVPQPNLRNFTLTRETVLEFGRLYRQDNDWRFQAVGQGYNFG
ncbi:TerD family protein [Okeania sp.]|nr:TerD family protein [Okeania sp.]